HANSIGPYEVRTVVIGRIGVIALRIPVLRRLRIEVGIRKQAQTHDARCIPIVRAHRKCHPVAGCLAARTDCNTGIASCVLAGIWPTAHAAHIEPQAVAPGIRSRWLLEARLIDEPERVPAVGPRIPEAGMRADELQQVESPEGVAGHLVPEAIIACGPDEP